jgi:heme-degrading monooxygenase HmoA
MLLIALLASGLSLSGAQAAQQDEIPTLLVNASSQETRHSPASARSDRIQVIYRLRVEEANRKRFEAAWAAVTHAALDRAPGARGSTLFRDPNEAGVFVAIARWESRTHWQQYRSGAPLNPAAASELTQTSVVISITVLEELADISRR